VPFSAVKGSLQQGGRELRSSGSRNKAAKKCRAVRSGTHNHQNGVSGWNAVYHSGCGQRR